MQNDNAKLKSFVLALIHFYQRAISPDHSLWGKARHPYGYCKYYPSCSEYAKQSIEKNGVAKGLMLAFWRVVRCNPWSRGGIDKVKILHFKL